MIIREANGELDISGSPAELNAIADRIEALAAGAALSIDADTAADPKPYHRCLVALDIRATDGPVRVAVSDDRVVVTGSVPMLGPFASYFRFDASAPHGRHHHHDYFDGDPYIAPDSLPLVVMVG